jgi:pimeloyl-ACP methyl ester carboxylesterase
MSNLNAPRQDNFSLGRMSVGYITIGEGSEIILAFHGFGRTADDMICFAKKLKPHQKLVSIGLFSHSISEFFTDDIIHKPLEPQEWKEFILAFLKIHGQTKFHLVGYSMGGRLAMVTAQLLPESVLSMSLYATDGLKINLLYRFASSTRVGLYFSRYLKQNPRPLFRIVDFLKTARLMPTKLHRFVYVHIDTFEKREQVFTAWLIYKKMFPDLRLLASIINKKGFKFMMVFGKYDSVIPPKSGRKFSDMIGCQTCFKQIDTGHRMLNEEAIEMVQF